MSANRLSGRPAIEGGEPAFDEFLVFGKPVLGDLEIDAVAEVIRSGWIGTGGRVEEFERRFAELVGAPYAVSLSSCTAALHSALVASGIGPGDEVVTTPFTFVATLHAIVHAGATPVLADVDPETFNIDPARVAELIGPRTRALLPVHFGGLPAELKTLRELAAQHESITVIEDAAHALGGRVDGYEVGGGGSLACFSFYPNKNITTGEGGMITTASAELADRLTVLRLHGLSRDAWKRFASKRVLFSDAVALGFKYNLTDLQAAMGIAQLGQLESFMDARRALARRYDEELADLPGLSAQPRPWTRELRHAHHLYIVRVDADAFGRGRDELLAALRAENIGAGVHYRAAHLHPYYRETLQIAPDRLPVATGLSDEVLSLPLSPVMTEDDVAAVADAMRRIHAFYATGRSS